MPLNGYSLAEKLRAGETLFTGWCALNAPLVAELIARDGFPAVTLDQQHGLYDTAGTVAGIAAVRHAGACPVVRIPVGDYAAASRALDFGAEGIIAPMINSEADARAFVAATKYPLVGERSWGPIRALTLTGVTGPTYVREANSETVAFAMIETREAIDNLPEILAVPGLDAVFVGPSDLSITLTDGKVLDPHAANVVEALAKILDAAQKAGKIAGVYAANAERAAELARQGFRFIAVASDLGFLRAGTQAALKGLKG